jgi:hypothetical protein
VNPSVIADEYGYVHVFWSESDNSIYYTRWDGESWTTPVDILFVPDDRVADFISVAVDGDGYLHVVWTGLTNIYYSNAPVAQAASARAWREPEVITTESARSAWESSIAVDGDGHIHVIYATRGNDPGVFHVESLDGGRTWGEAQRLSEPFDSRETSLARVRMIIDSAERLHAVWQTTEAGGYGQAVYYTRSTDRGQTWAAPQQLAYRNSGDFDVGWPYLMERESELHLIYNAGSEVGAAGRYERISTDGGQTWSGPRHIITEMIGINGYVIPLMDGAGQLHLIVNMRPRTTQKVGIYYSSLMSDGWSPVTPLIVDTPAADTAHFASATVARGNEIHIVWTQLYGGEIWHLSGTIQNLAPAEIQALPATVPTLTPEATATIISTRLMPPGSANIDSRLATTAINSASNSPLIPAVIATVAAIVIVAIAWRVRLRRVI